MSLLIDEIGQLLRTGILKAINKFREAPQIFFTEADLRSYLYYCLYSTKMEMRVNGVTINCLHQEYPNNFRYKPADLNQPPLPLDSAEGDRGNYDFVVLNPDFVRLCLDGIADANSLEEKYRCLGHIINKDYKLALQREKQQGIFKDHDITTELLYALEYKYVTKLHKVFIDGIRKDIGKLQLAYQQSKGNLRCISLVFCNTYPHGRDLRQQSDHLEEVVNIIRNAPSEILAIFVHSYYVLDSGELKKITPKPCTNHCRHSWARQFKF
ncbi:hypothetical protein G7K71_04055 [Desulfofundulus sp. TPOSR]|uniref:hypothetical protein n=1 Tax=Desulfofundulus sp. TPOSR TaxID=2714340 RepID=UPI001407FDA5|nr:hypothetical protein [Desulfofundulus sp. TPOSR]NHM26187.1 hypothetical protein [Desulfofundulus sp. TPOSR]